MGFRFVILVAIIIAGGDNYFVARIIEVIDLNW
jgi:hypothetical protein